MKIPFNIFKIALVILLFTKGQLYGQCTNKPVFNGLATDGIKEDNLNKFVESAFRTRYHKYFEASCGYYYDVIRFSLDSGQKLSDISFAGPESSMTRFIRDVLLETNGNWSIEKCKSYNAKTLSIIMPVYFEFFNTCTDSASSKPVYYEKPMDRSGLKITMNGMTILYFTNAEVVLSPVRLRGRITEDPMNFDKQ